MLGGLQAFKNDILIGMHFRNLHSFQIATITECLDHRRLIL